MDSETQKKISETVMEILRNSDMEEMTEYKVRKEAADKLGTDLSEPSRKKFVRQVVESFLQEQQQAQAQAQAQAQNQNDAVEEEEQEEEEEEEESNTRRSDGKEYDEEGDLILCKVSFSFQN